MTKDEINQNFKPISKAYRMTKDEINQNFKPINPKHRKLLNKVIEWNVKYNDRVDYLSANDLDSSNDGKADSAHDKAWDFWAELPRREKVSLNRQYTRFFGYDLGFPI